MKIKVPEEENNPLLLYEEQRNRHEYWYPKPLVFYKTCVVYLTFHSHSHLHLVLQPLFHPMISSPAVKIYHIV